MEMIQDRHVNVVFKYPFVLGHEGVGEIVECGAKVKNFAVGEHIVFPLGKTGNGNPADSGFYINSGHYAEYGVVKDLMSMREDGIDVRDMEKDLEGFARKIPASIPFADGGVIVPMRETLSAARNVGITKGSKVLLYGDGPNGFGFATFAKYLGAEWIGLVGHNEKRMDHFRKHTAVDLYINSHTQNVTEEMRKAGVTPDIAVDGVGRHEIMIEASNLVRRRRQGCSVRERGAKAAYARPAPVQKQCCAAQALLPRRGLGRKRRTVRSDCFGKGGSQKLLQPHRADRRLPAGD